MFIQTETTPNPASLKFIPGQAVMETGTVDFASSEAATRSPLAKRLFAIAGVAGVFLGADFITVRKTDERDWQVIKPEILGAIMEHFTLGEPVLVEDGSKASAAPDGDEDEIVVQIRELLETRVRPAVAQDGGDIVFQGYEDGVVFLELHGACSGCPSSTATLKNGIENLLKHYIPEIQEVRAVS
ncbi:MAG: NifU family protein [Alphaproteobacteria bacterium]|nr:NifU family protein [Alphaproteobacteria bacterium]